jgi:hypothetical protein
MEIYSNDWKGTPLDIDRHHSGCTISTDAKHPSQWENPVSQLKKRNDALDGGYETSTEAGESEGERSQLPAGALADSDFT